MLQEQFISASSNLARLLCMLANPIGLGILRIAVLINVISPNFTSRNRLTRVWQSGSSESFNLGKQFFYYAIWIILIIYLFVYTSIICGLKPSVCKIQIKLSSAYILKALALFADCLWLIVACLYLVTEIRSSCFRIASNKENILGSINGDIVPASFKISLLLTLLNSFSDFGLKYSLIDNELMKDIFRATFTPLLLLLICFIFLFPIHGVCQCGFLSTMCPQVKFHVEVLSHIRYTLEFNVNFPDLKTGLQTRHKIVDIRYTSVLLDHKQRNSSFPCEIGRDEQSSLNESDSVKKNYCDFEVYTLLTDSYRSPNSYFLGSVRGVLLEWPCQVTMKIQRLRSEVKCLYRVKVELNDQSQFAFNYDYVYKLPESATSNSDEWHATSQYSMFDHIINSGSDENFEDFRDLFRDVDEQLSQLRFDAPMQDLLSTEPHTLHVICNRTCLCYECIADKFVERPIFCTILCPQKGDYINYHKKDFCKSDQPDQCRAEWKTIFRASARVKLDNYSQLLPLQSPPNVTVVIADKSIPTIFDSSILLPLPSKITI